MSASESGLSGALDLSVIAAVNDEAVLERNLLQSPILKSGRVPLRTYRGQPSAAVAYNRGLEETGTDYIAFVHQDVYLPGSWEERLRTAIACLAQSDPEWAVLGTVGVDPKGRHVGAAWSSGLARAIGQPFSGVVPVASVDELAFVVRRAAGSTFDESLPGFHLYGTDIVQSARQKGRRSYVAYLPVVHNSRPVTGLGGPYATAYRYMQRKWREELPLPTAIVPITRCGLPLWRARANLMLTAARRRAGALSPESDPQEIAGILGYE